MMVIGLLAFFTFSSVTPSRVYADAGPSKNQFQTIVIAPLAIAAIVMSIIVYFKLKKPAEKVAAEKVPVTAVRFDWEEVRLSINPDSDEMFVEALFEYENSLEKGLRMDLLFPFVSSYRDTISDFSATLLHRDGTPPRPLAFTAEEQQVTFDFAIQPLEKLRLKVFYREKLRGESAAYVITSIKKWQRPVREARFSVRLPARIVKPQFAFQEGLTGIRELKDENAVVYDFLLRDIYPDREFTINWQAKL